MSLPTTIAAVTGALEGVAGVYNVVARPGLPNDRELYEATLGAEGALQRWVVFYGPSLPFAGLDSQPELDVEVLAVWAFDEAEDTFAEFVDRYAAVLVALSSALPQIDARGIEAVESPGDPVTIESGHAVYRARLRFHLLDTVHT